MFYFPAKKAQDVCQAVVSVLPGPLGLSLYPAVSGGRDILLGDRFRTKLAYTPPLLTTSIELGCKKM